MLVFLIKSCYQFFHLLHEAQKPIFLRNYLHLNNLDKKNLNIKEITD